MFQNLNQQALQNSIHAYGFLEDLHLGYTPESCRRGPRVSGCNIAKLAYKNSPMDRPTRRKMATYFWPLTGCVSVIFLAPYLQGAVCWSTSGCVCVCTWFLTCAETFHPGQHTRGQSDVVLPEVRGEGAVFERRPPRR